MVHEPPGGSADFIGDGDATTNEHYEQCCEDAAKLYDALERGHIYYESKVRVHQRGDVRTHAGRLLAVTREMLGKREATTEMIAVLLFSARGVDEYPNKLRAFFDEFIRHPALDLPKELARSCRVRLPWFNRWARDYHQSGGVDIPWADDQVIRSGLSALVDNFLASLCSVNEVIELLERGVMHFFKTVINSQKERPTVDPQVVAERVAAPDGPDSEPSRDPVQITGELWYRLSQTFDDTNPVWRPANAWLTAALIDLGCDPLPEPAISSLARCPGAGRELEKHRARYIDVPSDPVDRTGLPRDSRVRLRVALAALADLLELGAPIRLHDRTYLKHKRAVRIVRDMLRAYRNELAQRAAAAQEHTHEDE